MRMRRFGGVGVLAGALFLGAWGSAPVTAEDPVPEPFRGALGNDIGIHVWRPQHRLAMELGQILNGNKDLFGLASVVWSDREVVMGGSDASVEAARTFLISLDVPVEEPAPLPEERREVLVSVDVYRVRADAGPEAWQVVATQFHKADGRVELTGIEGIEVVERGLLRPLIGNVMVDVDTGVSGIRVMGVRMVGEKICFQFSYARRTLGEQPAPLNLFRLDSEVAMESGRSVILGSAADGSSRDCLVIVVSATLAPS